MGDPRVAGIVPVVAPIANLVPQMNEQYVFSPIASYIYLDISIYKELWSRWMRRMVIILLIVLDYYYYYYYYYYY